MLPTDKNSGLVCKGKPLSHWWNSDIDTDDDDELTQEEIDIQYAHQILQHRSLKDYNESDSDTDLTLNLNEVDEQTQAVIRSSDIPEEVQKLVFSFIRKK